MKKMVFRTKIKKFENWSYKPMMNRQLINLDKCWPTEDYPFFVLCIFFLKVDYVQKCLKLYMIHNLWILIWTLYISESYWAHRVLSVCIMEKIHSMDIELKDKTNNNWYNAFEVRSLIKAKKIGQFRKITHTIDFR